MNMQGFVFGNIWKLLTKDSFDFGSQTSLLYFDKTDSSYFEIIDLCIIV